MTPNGSSPPSPISDATRHSPAKAATPAKSDNIPKCENCGQPSHLAPWYKEHHGKALCQGCGYNEYYRDKTQIVRLPGTSKGFT